MLELKNISKKFKDKEILSNFNLKVEENKILAIVGPSGGGKTTLLRMLAGLESIDSGEIIFNGENLPLNELEKRNLLGFVFQDFQLFPHMTVLENLVISPIQTMGIKKDEAEAKAIKLLEQLGLEKHYKSYPYSLSGGQKQRVAVARAVITNPALLLADEPTGALDSQSSETLLKMFRTINSTGQTIIMVTHSLRAASYANRVLFIKDGVVYHEIYRGENERQSEFMERINQAQFMLNRGEQ